jgi:hypothetical protein
LKKIILPTDSRRRLDVRYLIKGEDKRATAWKQIGENKQREEEKELKVKTGKDEVRRDVSDCSPLEFLGSHLVQD